MPKKGTAKGVLKWIMGDMSLTPALKKQVNTLSQQGIRGTRRDRALTGRPAPDVIAKAWEWIIGEQPLEPPKKRKSKRFKIPKLGKLKKFVKISKWKKKARPIPEAADEEESGMVGTQQSRSQVPDSPHHSDSDSEFGSHPDRDVDESDDEREYYHDDDSDHPPPDYTTNPPTSR